MKKYVCKKCKSSDNVVIGKPNWNNVGCKACNTVFIIGRAEISEHFTMFNMHEQNSDSVKHHSHYTWHPSGVECLTIAQEFNFNRGNAIKYVWRAGEKGNEIEDLKKARWYIDREIQRMEKVK